jgi:hypothetical protein
MAKIQIKKQNERKGRIPVFGLVAELVIQRLRLLRFARNDTKKVRGREGGETGCLIYRGVVVFYKKVQNLKLKRQNYGFEIFRRIAIWLWTIIRRQSDKGTLRR